MDGTGRFAKEARGRREVRLPVVVAGFRWGAPRAANSSARIWQISRNTSAESSSDEESESSSEGPPSSMSSLPIGSLIVSVALR